MMLSETDVRNVITSTVRAELAPCAVRVNVREREDYDKEERTFVVTVSIETECSPDNRKMLGLTRKIRLRLNEANVQDGFPILSFISSHEENKSGLEFA